MDNNSLPLSNKVSSRPLVMDPLKINLELLPFHFSVPLKSRSSLVGMWYQAVTKPKGHIAAKLQALLALSVGSKGCVLDS
jgi:hypothetical protein